MTNQLEWQSPPFVPRGGVGGALLQGPTRGLNLLAIQAPLSPFKVFRVNVERSRLVTWNSIGLPANCPKSLRNSSSPLETARGRRGFRCASSGRWSPDLSVAALGGRWPERRYLKFQRTIVTTTVRVVEPLVMVGLRTLKSNNFIAWSCPDPKPNSLPASSVPVVCKHKHTLEWMEANVLLSSISECYEHRVL